MDERLAKAGIEDDARADALDTLERVGYVDDGRFALSRAAALAGRGYGDAYVRHVLEAEGVGADLVEAAVAALEPEAERAERLAALGGRTEKLAAQLQRKGFGQDALERAFGPLFADLGEEA
ncbi:MAG TPA: RecX family transcriptional regulator [Gaiellaceae bacterium]|nr:RecX family transcriptional regulator [Gaiellaceae bacterium]